MPRQSTSISVTDKGLQDRIKRTGDGSFSGGVDFVSRFYYGFLQENLPECTIDEVNFFINSFHDLTTRIDDLHLLKTKMYLSISAYCSAKNGASASSNAIMDHINGFSILECLAITEAVRGYVTRQESGINNPMIKTFFNIKEEDNG